MADELFDRALGEALTTMMAADPPLALGEELARAVGGEALRAIVTERVEQIVRHGYGAEHEAALALRQLPALARSQIIHGMDRLSGGDLVAGRRWLAKAAAVLMAAIDRIDVERGE
jgi:hypothetical protein